MNRTQENREKVIRYLYGELIGAERDRFEERLFADEKLGLLLEDTENDLIDEYLRGELEFEEKRRFEKSYLVSESRRQRVDLARNLHRELFAQSPDPVVAVSEKRSFRQRIAGLFRMPDLILAGGLAAALLLIMLGGFWFFNQSDRSPELAGGKNANREENREEISPPPSPVTPQEERPPGTVEQTPEKKESEKELPAAEKPASPTKKRPVQRPSRKKRKTNRKPAPARRREPPRIFAFSLLPPLRSTTTPVLNIPASAQTVRLQLFDDFGGSYEKFIVELNGSGGQTIWSREIGAAKKQPQKSIGISIPADRLAAGDYEITVSGISKEGSVEDISFYNFVVRRDGSERDGESEQDEEN